MTSGAVTLSSRDGISWIALDKPERLNIIDDELVSALNQAWHDFEASDDRCAVLVGNGPKAFCAGADLNSFSGEMWQAVPGVGVKVTKPIVAAVHGYCVGGGCVIMSFCDLVVAGRSSQFWYPEAQVGFTGGVAASLASRIPLKFAAEFVLLGDRIDADRACSIGLVNRVVDDDDLRDCAGKLARRLADSAPLVVDALKDLMARTVPRSPIEQACASRNEMLTILNSEDWAEGRRAFNEKRAGVFQGR